MSTRKPASQREKIADNSPGYATVSLKYTGIMSGYTNVNVGIAVEMDTSIGIRYEITYTLGVKSHTAFFYKFSNPNQIIYYNFLTHKSEVIKNSGSAKEPEVSVVGTAVIKNYSCTHLHHENDKGNATEDYWMSTAVPGFAQVSSVLNKIDPSLKQMIINQSIFNWGGLVELKMKDVSNDGQTTTFNLYLTTAQAGIPINLADFEVPSK
jgi:hypothetical protein